MDMRAEMSRSTAIRIGAPIVAVGLLLVGCDAPAPKQEPAPAREAAPAAPVVASREVVRAQAIEALSYHRPTLRTRCYQHAVAGESPPPPVGFTFDFTFGPAGEQIARGVVEDRGTGSAAITQCVTDLLPPLRIPPPGQIVMVEVPLKFP